MNEIKDHGKITRGRLGVYPQDLSPALARSFGLKDSKGALVAKVEEGGPAALAGIQQGDVIREINGVAIENPDALRFKIAETAPGTNLTVKIWHNGAEKTVTAKLGTLDEKIASNNEPLPSGNQSGKLGVSVQDLTPQVARQLGVQASGTGVVITQVQPDSPADEAGIRRGDIVQEVNRQPINPPAIFSLRSTSLQSRFFC
jgi:serine protease Do